jgi:methylenetetrahydrofolate dehydrogenase (NADP+)/methenyltetrahydrofolate cyclohydrolase
MSTQLIDGKRIAAELRSRVAIEVEQFARATGQKPGPATVLGGQDSASEVNLRNNRRSAVEAGMADLHRHLEPGSSQDEVIALIDGPAAHGAVSGILLQLPLPTQLDSTPLIDRIPGLKDVDGLTTMSAGLLAQGGPGLRSYTPTGVIKLIDSTSFSMDGASVVHVGIHRTAHGWVGDVRFEELPGIAGWLTPVPGGVGPLTIAALPHNTLTAARTQPALESAS